MRIVAASFMEHVVATAAMNRLSDELGVGHGTIRVAPLGRAAEPHGPTVVLAGRFQDDAVGAVRTVVEELDGTVVIDVDVAATNG
jgi:histone H3/H4